MARPHTEFIHAQDLEWETGVLPDHLGSLECKVLSMDNVTGACSLIVRYPAGWSLSKAVHLEGSHEFLVLDGTLEISSQRYSFDSYAYLPSGALHENWFTRDGAVALTFFSSLPAIHDGPGSSIEEAIPYVYLHDVDWSTEGIDPDLAFLRIAHKILRRDEDKGETTMILNSGAQTHPKDWKEGALAHPCVEEMFLLSGDIIADRGVMHAGAYFWRPPEIWHGPFGSRNGHLCVIRFLDGHHVNKWSAEKYSFSLTPDYKPDLPDNLQTLANRPFSAPTPY